MEQHNATQPLLSICIPTFNRGEKVTALVRDILSVYGALEVRVHIDGSNDSTLALLREISDPRLKVSFGSNVGRAGAIVKACKAARGKFIMLYDDDDLLYPERLKDILKYCSADCPSGTAGFIFHMESAKGDRIGSEFPVERTNLLSLRNDFHVKGDKKEVVLAQAFKDAIYDGHNRYRRVPSSLVWARIALRYDIISHNLCIGEKNYLEGGLTDNIMLLKRQNAYPMFLLYRTQVLGFLQCRYRSFRAFVRAFIGLLYYGFFALLNALRPQKGNS